MCYNMLSSKGGLSVKILLMIILVLAAAGMVYLSYRLEKRRKKYINGVKKFADESRHFEGTVTSTAKGYIMLKFRDEEQKKTIHHKYSYARRRYKTDSPVTVFYDEQSDSACVEGDNPFVHKAFWCAMGSVACIVCAAAMLAVGVINLLK